MKLMDHLHQILIQSQDLKEIEFELIYNKNHVHLNLLLLLQQILMETERFTLEPTTIIKSFNSRLDLMMELTGLLTERS